MTGSPREHLLATEDGLDDLLFDFVDSICRGGQLVFDNYYLPVGLIGEVNVDNALAVLAVTGLRSAVPPHGVIRKYTDEIRVLIDRNVYIDIEDLKMRETGFDQLFNEHLNKNH